MVLTIEQRYADIDDLEAERAFLHRFARACFDGGDVVARNDATLYGFAEGEAAAALVGANAQLDIRELPGTAGLFAMPVVNLGRLRDCLAVDRAGHSIGDLDVED